MGMKRTLTALVALAALMATFPATPSASADLDLPHATERPEVKRKIADHRPNHPVTLVVIEGPRNVWGMRSVSRGVERRISGLRIIQRPGVQCSDYPRAACVRVRVASWNARQQERIDGGLWRGMVEYRSFWDYRIVRLNRYNTKPRDRRWVAAHELGHALGLGHHKRRGAVGEKDTLRKFPFSRGEMRVLRRAFNSRELWGPYMARRSNEVRIRTQPRGHLIDMKTMTGWTVALLLGLSIGLVSPAVSDEHPAPDGGPAVSEGSEAGPDGEPVTDDSGGDVGDDGGPVDDGSSPSGGAPAGGDGGPVESPAPTPGDDAGDDGAPVGSGDGGPTDDVAPDGGPGC